MSRTGVRSIIKKFKVNHTLQNKTDKGRKRNISKSLERKLARNVSKELRTIEKTLVNSLAMFGIEFSKKTITRILHKNRLRNHTLLLKRHLQARLKYITDN